MSQNTPARKVSITIPGRDVGWVESRLDAFGGSLSKYFHYLIDIDRRGGGAVEASIHRQKVERVLSRLFPDGIVGDGHGGRFGIIAKDGRTGYYPVMYFNKRDLLRDVANMAISANEHDVDNLVLVLPDDASLADLNNWKDLGRVGFVVEITVVRVGEL